MNKGTACYTTQVFIIGSEALQKLYIQESTEAYMMRRPNGQLKMRKMLPRSLCQPTGQAWTDKGNAAAQEGDYEYAVEALSRL